MTWFTGTVVYILVWWVVLFAVLPLWVTPAEPDDPGFRCRRAATAAAAAESGKVTTGVAAVIWLVIYLIVRSPWLSFRGP